MIRFKSVMRGAQMQSKVMESVYQMLNLNQDVKMSTILFLKIIIM